MGNLSARVSSLLAIVVFVATLALIGCSKANTYDLNDISVRITQGMKVEDLKSQIGPPSHEIPGDNGEIEYRYDSKDGNGSLLVTINNGVVTNFTRKD